MKNPFKGLNTYSLGGRALGVQLTVRNLNVTSRSQIPRRYIRLILKLAGYSLTLEFRFSNSI